jgi:hypothetical protein
MKPITIWKRFDDKTRRFEFNHIEDGHISPLIREPKPIGTYQRKAWKNALWVHFPARLNDQNEVVPE